MLEVSNLSRSYGDFKAVNSASFNIAQGEIVGLLGHNGAGKTTIMKMLSGYLEPNQGSIQVDNIDLEEHLKQVQQSLGYLPENLPVYPEMIVADYLDYAADLKGLQSEQKQADITRVVEATDISAKLLAPISTLSRGYKQRVGVAQAILGKPKLLILDEPTNGLDPTQTEHMRQLIRDIAKHATVILSTHIMQEVDALCDRVLILSGGHLVVDAKLDELRKTNHTRLSTSMQRQTVDERLATINGIKSIESISGDRVDNHAQQVNATTTNQYRIEVNSEQPLQKVNAAIARTVIEAGADLFQLQNEQRDLETLFREVSDPAFDSQTNLNNREDLNNAA